MEEGRNMKKIVLITGASSDIGSEIASLLGDSYEVILHYNNNYDEVMKGGPHAGSVCTPAES